MRPIVIALVLLAVVALVHPAPAEENPRTRADVMTPDAARTRVYVSHTGSDAAGKAFVAGLRTGVNSSSRFRLAENEDDADLVLIIVSVSPEATPRVASAISLAYVANNEWRSLLGTAARFVGKDKAELMGRAVVDEMASVLAAYDPTAVQ